MSFYYQLLFLEIIILKLIFLPNVELIAKQVTGGAEEKTSGSTPVSRWRTTGINRLCIKTCFKCPNHHPLQLSF